MPEVDESKLGWEIYTLNFKLTCFLPTLLYLHWVHRVNLLFQRPVPLLTSIPQAIAPSGSPTQHSCCLLCSSLAHHLPARSRSSATDLYCHSSLCLSISNEGSAPPSHGLQSPSSYIPPAFPLSHPPDCSFKVINKGSDVKSTCAHPIRTTSQHYLEWRTTPLLKKCSLLTSVRMRPGFLLPQWPPPSCLLASFLGPTSTLCGSSRICPARIFSLHWIAYGCGFNCYLQDDDFQLWFSILDFSSDILGPPDISIWTSLGHLSLICQLLNSWLHPHILPLQTSTFLEITWPLGHC